MYNDVLFTLCIIYSPAASEHKPVVGEWPRYSDDIDGMPVFVAIPGIVPPASHVTVQSVPDSKITERINKVVIMHLCAGIYDARSSVDKRKYPVAPEFITAVAAPLPIVEDDELLEAYAPFSCGILNSLIRFFGVPYARCSVHICESSQILFGFSTLKLSFRRMPSHDVFMIESQLICRLERSCHAHQTVLIIL